MKLQKLALFCAISSFCYADTQVSPERVARLVLGTTSTMSGLTINMIMARLDIALFNDTNYRLVAPKIKSVGFLLQHFGDWIKYKASSKQIMLISFLVLLFIYYNFQFSCWLAKKTLKAAWPFRKKKSASKPYAFGDL